MSEETESFIPANVSRFSSRINADLLHEAELAHRLTTIQAKTVAVFEGREREKIEESKKAWRNVTRIQRQNEASDERRRAYEAARAARTEALAALYSITHAFHNPSYGELLLEGEAPKNGKCISPNSEAILMAPCDAQRFLRAVNAYHVLKRLEQHDNDAPERSQQPTRRDMLTAGNSYLRPTDIKYSPEEIMSMTTSQMRGVVELFREVGSQIQEHEFPGAQISRTGDKHTGRPVLRLPPTTNVIRSGASAQQKRNEGDGLAGQSK